MHSQFIAGLNNEEHSFVLDQIGLWKKPLRSGLKVGSHLSDIFSESDITTLRVCKLCILLDFISVNIDHEITPEELDELGFKIEIEAVRMLSEHDKNFKGTTIEELVQHVVNQMFENSQKEFSKMSEEEQLRIANEISSKLKELDPKSREQLLKSSGLSDLSAEALMQSGGIATLGIGLSSLVTFFGFSAYTTLTSLIAGFAGIFGLTLPFGFYMGATSLLAFFTGPLGLLAFSAASLLIVQKKSKEIKTKLFPFLVASSVVSQSENESFLQSQRVLCEEINECFRTFHRICSLAEVESKEKAESIWEKELEFIWEKVAESMEKEELEESLEERLKSLENELRSYGEESLEELKSQFSEQVGCVKDMFPAFR